MVLRLSSTFQLYLLLEPFFEALLVGAVHLIGVVRMAHHIVSIEDLDKMLGKGDFRAVESIRRGHGIRLNSGEDRDFYSFATKYCHFHNSGHFPMWDTLVSELLYRWSKAKAWRAIASQESLRDYGRYHEIVTTARDELVYAAHADPF